MRTAEDVRHYLEDVRPEGLISTAQDNGASPIFSELLALLPTDAKFRNPGEVVEHLERVRGLG